MMYQSRRLSLSEVPNESFVKLLNVLRSIDIEKLPADSLYKVLQERIPEFLPHLSVLDTASSNPAGFKLLHIGSGTRRHQGLTPYVGRYLYSLPDPVTYMDGISNDYMSVLYEGIPALWDIDACPADGYLHYHRMSVPMGAFSDRFGILVNYTVVDKISA